MDFPTKDDFNKKLPPNVQYDGPLDVEKAVEETLHHIAAIARKGHIASGLDLNEWMTTARTFVEKAKGKNFSLTDTNNESKGADIAEAIRLSLNVTPLLLQKMKLFLQLKEYTPEETAVLTALINFVEGG